MLTAVLLAPLAVLLGHVLARDGLAIVPVATTIGVLAAVVQVPRTCALAVPCPGTRTKVRSNALARDRLPAPWRRPSRYETNAFRTVAADHRGPPCGVGTPLRFSDSAISSSAIPFASIALIFIRQP
jgi:hypothetical protein